MKLNAANSNRKRGTGSPPLLPGLMVVDVVNASQALKTASKYPANWRALRGSWIHT